MPNYCDFKIKAKGRPKDVAAFEKVLNADYNYADGQIPEALHFWRVFECDKEATETIEENVVIATFNGYCAWSVFCCMFDGPFSYQASANNKYGKKHAGTTIPLVCQKHNLTIEIWSSESGMSFQEHYIVTPEGIKVNEEFSGCCEYNAYEIANEYKEGMDNYDDEDIQLILEHYNLDKDTWVEEVLANPEKYDDYITLGGSNSFMTFTI